MKYQDIPVSGNGMDIRAHGPMFVMIEHAVLDEFPEMTPHQFIVYAALMAYTNSEPRCVPSIAALAKRAHIGTTATKEALNRLVEYGLVRKFARTDDAGDPTSNLYVVYRPSVLKGVGRQTTDPRRETTQGGSPDDPGWVAKRPLSISSEVDPPENIENSLVSWNESAAFIEFWSAYPKERHVARPAAEKAFRKHVTESNFADVLAGLDKWKVSGDWIKRGPEGQVYIPYAQKFLNQHMWEGEPTQPPVIVSLNGHREEIPGVTRPYTREEARQRIMNGSGS